MKKLAFIMILLFICLSAAFSDTVLCCISDNEDDPDKHSSWEISVLRAFEDGVLDVFFDAGHIVTNSFINECKTISGDEAKTQADVARIMANRMGADSVVMLEIIFPLNTSDNLAVPEKAAYAMYSNSGKSIADESETIFDIASERGEEELLDSFTEIGRNIASGLASNM